MDVDIYCLFFMDCGFNDLGVNNKMTKDEALKMAIERLERFAWTISFVVGYLLWGIYVLR
jgi:hypothetical protein